jgi:2-iminobutanoate/2-iminopropanoate deaminase
VKRAITSPGAPRAIGPYSPAIRVGRFVFLSGQVPIDPATGALVDGDIRVQTRRVLDNIRALLEAAGVTCADVVRTTVFLAELADFDAMNEVYAAYFPTPAPARSTVQVARLPRDARVEIDAVASLTPLVRSRPARRRARR